MIATLDTPLSLLLNFTKRFRRTAGSGTGLLGIPGHRTEAISLFAARQKAGKTYGSDTAHRPETAFSNAYPHC